MPAPLRVSVLLSGGGRTLQNFLDRDLPIDVVQVIASRPDAFGLERARSAGIPTLVLRRAAFSSTAAYTAEVFSAVRAAEAQVACLAGWLKLLRPIPPDYQGRVLNVHPALIPAFCGKGFYGHHVHEAALAAGVKLSGCTVHFVDDEYDHGPIVAQRAVPVEDDDTPETLAARVFAAECEVYPEVLRLLAAGRLELEGRRVRLRA